MYSSHARSVSREAIVGSRFYVCEKTRRNKLKDVNVCVWVCLC